MLRGCRPLFCAAAASPLALSSDVVAEFGRMKVFDEGDRVWRVQMRTAPAEGKSKKWKVNLMDGKFFEDLHATFSFLTAADDNVRACVLHGPPGGHFSAGLDLKHAGQEFMKDVPTAQKAKIAMTTLAGMKPPSLAVPGMPAMRAMDMRRLIQRYQDAISEVARCRVPVIAAVHGQCIGGAVDLITACDMRYGSADATVSIREAAVGIVADIGTLQRTGRIVGEGTLREWTYTARDIAAEEALRARLFNDVLPTPDAALGRSLEVARQVAKTASPLAVQGAKEMLNHVTEREAQEALEHVRLWNTAFLQSEDLIEAAVAFAQKRKPKFEGNWVVDSRTAVPRPHRSHSADGKKRERRSE